MRIRVGDVVTFERKVYVVRDCFPDGTFYIEGLNSNFKYISGYRLSRIIFIEI
jgi:hypothetical protein